MKSYKVIITETLQKEIRVKANSLAEAEEIAEADWNDEIHVLGADDFVEAKFTAKEINRNRNER